MHKPTGNSASAKKGGGPLEHWRQRHSLLNGSRMRTASLGRWWILVCALLLVACGGGGNHNETGSISLAANFTVTPTPLITPLIGGPSAATPTTTATPGRQGEIPLECPSGQSVGCDGACYPMSWIGDGACDDGFNCDSFENDDGDCSVTACDAGDIEACDGFCHRLSAIGDGICDPVFDCAAFQRDEGDCLNQNLARDFPVFDSDGPGIGKFRDCTPTMDCTPTRDCTPTQDCTPTRDCDHLPHNHDTRDCNRCLLSVFGNCVQRGNDPVCEAEKAAQNAIYDADYAARKADCERIKAQEKVGCEAEKAAWKLDCERIKSEEKLACEADKSAKKLDCERVKESQQLTGEVYEAFIHHSRDIALGENLRPMPPDVRRMLDAYFDAELLDRVRWTDDHGDIFSAQKFATELAQRGAITLDSIIVFKEAARASEVGLWAHELEHVKQYSLLGIDGFAQYFTFECSLIEHLASEQSSYVCGSLGCVAEGGECGL